MSALRFIALLLGLFAYYVNAQTQTISANPNKFIVPLNSTFTLELAYNTSDSNNTLSGLTLEMYFDSRKLTTALNNINTFSNNHLGQELASDNNNEDGDSNTNQKFSVVWLDFNRNWPNQPLPLLILNATFTLTALFTGSTYINFSGAAANGYAFAATPIIIRNSPDIIGGNGQNITASDNLEPFSVNYGSNNAGVQVRFKAPSGAVFSNDANIETQTADNNGIATSSALTDTNAGKKTLQVSATGFATQTLSYTITADVASITYSTITILQNSIVANGANIPIAEISAKDQYQNLTTAVVTATTSNSNFAVTISPNDKTYTLFASSTIMVTTTIITTAINGVVLATFTITTAGSLVITNSTATLTKNTIRANGIDSTTITITLRDNANRPTAGVIRTEVSGSLNLSTITFDNINSTYYLNATTTKLGTATVHIFVDNTPLATLTITASFTLDIDGNGVIRANSDGILILRYITNITGANDTFLVANTIGANANRKNAADIRNYLNQVRNILDIDGASSPDIKDAYLLLRYLIGVRGHGLTQSLTTNTPTAVKNYLDNWYEIYYPID